MSDYFADPEEYLKKAGIDSSAIIKPNTKYVTGHNWIFPIDCSINHPRKRKKKKNGAASPITCTICFDDVDPGSYTALEGCSHSFCNDCWRANLEMQIKDGHTFDIECMSKGCLELVPSSVVEYVELCQ